jgi:phenylalanyl-tRNA synthetase alpha chain
MEMIKKIESALDLKELENLRVEFLGKNGIITKQLKELGQLSIEEKKTKGKEINELKVEIAQAIEIKKIALSDNDSENEIDYTIYEKTALGSAHIISQEIKTLNEIFNNIGFKSISGPDIETTYYNFEALNIEEAHPARDDNDTFYMKEEGKLLRTQVTSVQIRLLEEMKKSHEKECRAFSIGRVYRNDSHDATHVSSFHQVEGIIIEENITMQHLKGFLTYLFEEFFQQKVNIRFRPSYFPFTEPSCEVDICAEVENGKLIMKEWGQGKALEVGGCGIIHPKILKNFGMPEANAFAFGMGLERMIMLKNNIPNINTLYNNQMPFLKTIK